MSRGYFGIAYLTDNDGEYVLYSYSCCDINRPDWRDYKDRFDGLIMIRRTAFIEPHIREKMLRTRSRKSKKKRILRRVRREFSAEELCIKGHIIVENAAGTWIRRESGIDWMALNLIDHIFNEYQDTGKIPEAVCFASQRIIKKVIIEEFFSLKETGLHGAVRTDMGYHLRTGDIVQDQNGNIYKILAVGFPCSITARDFFLRLEELQEYESEKA